MRIRTIKPDFCFDDKIAELSMTTRLAFIGLWMHADRDGRLVDNPSKLKALIFPYDKVDMSKTLSELSKKPFIHRYSVEGKRYIQVINWHRHQRVHHSEPLSTIPAMEEGHGETTVEEPLSPGEKSQERKGKERKGKEGGTPIMDGTPTKTKYLEFVYLYDSEYKLLGERIGVTNADSYIQRLNDYIGAKGDKYNSHYHVISGWYRRDHPEERPQMRLLT